MPAWHLQNCLPDSAYSQIRETKDVFLGCRGAPQMLVQARHFHRYSRKKGAGTEIPTPYMTNCNNIP